jgi:hypothetical protein
MRNDSDNSCREKMNIFCTWAVSICLTIFKIIKQSRENEPEFMIYVHFLTCEFAPWYVNRKVEQNKRAGTEWLIVPGLFLDAYYDN